MKLKQDSSPLLMQTHGIKRQSYNQRELQYFLLDYNRKNKYPSCYHALDFYPIQMHGKCPYTFLGFWRTAICLTLHLPIQTNRKSNLQAGVGKVRTMCMQSTRSEGETRSWVFLLTQCAKLREWLPGVFYFQQYPLFVFM